VESTFTKTLEVVVGLGDKASNKKEDLGGKAKEGTGKAVGNESLEAEGKGDQASASAKDGVEKVKDGAKNIKDAFKK
jgi:uncharacterized protein YjbJ (UPF0337 family)